MASVVQTETRAAVLAEKPCLHVFFALCSPFMTMTTHTTAGELASFRDFFATVDVAYRTITIMLPSTLD